MKLKVLGSGSSGNCYVLIADSGEKLILDLGVDFKRVKDIIGYNLIDVAAVVTHSHGDHASQLKKALDSGIEVIGSDDTFEAFNLLSRENANFFVMNPSRFANQDNLVRKYKGFTIAAYLVQHDVTCHCFAIHHKEMGWLVYVTDAKEVPYKFPASNHFLVEANYDEQILIDNVLDGSNYYLAERVVNSHLSLQECKAFLSDQDLTKTDNIILCHLSNRNSDAERFKKEITQLTGVKTEVAEPGLEIDLTIL